MVTQRAFLFPGFEMVLPCVGSEDALALGERLDYYEIKNRIDGSDVVIPHAGDALFIWGVADAAARFGFVEDGDACGAAVAACENVAEYIRRRWGLGAPPIEHPAVRRVSVINEEAGR